MRPFAAVAAASLTVVCMLPGPGADAARRAPAVVVVDSPVAEKWLQQAGIAYSARPGALLGAMPLAGARLLILPMAAVTSPDAARTVESFAARGGRVVAVYWGTLVGPGGGAPPSYQLAEILGVRPVGWTGETPQEVVLSETGTGALPYSGPRVSIPLCQSTLVQPLLGSRVVASWGGDDTLDPASPGAIFLHGNALYIAPNILRPGNDRPEVRELFFWAIQRVAPDFGPTLQARDRIAAAAGACSAAAGLVPWDAPPALRQDLEAAQNALKEARALLGRNPLKAIQAADRARTLAERLTQQAHSGAAE